MFPERDIRIAFTISVQIFIGGSDISIFDPKFTFSGRSMDNDTATFNTSIFNLAKHLNSLFGSEKARQQPTPMLIVDSTRLSSFSTKSIDSISGNNS